MQKLDDFVEKHVPLPCQKEKVKEASAKCDKAIKELNKTLNGHTAIKIQ